MHFRIALTLGMHRALRAGNINQQQYDKYMEFLKNGTPAAWNYTQALVAGRVQQRGLGKVGSVNWGGILTFLQGLWPLILQIIQQFFPTPAGVKNHKTGKRAHCKGCMLKPHETKKARKIKGMKHMTAPCKWPVKKLHKAVSKPVGKAAVKNAKLGKVGPKVLAKQGKPAFWGKAHKVAKPLGKACKVVLLATLLSLPFSGPSNAANAMQPVEAGASAPSDSNATGEAYSVCKPTPHKGGHKHKHPTKPPIVTTPPVVPTPTPDPISTPAEPSCSCTADSCKIACAWGCSSCVCNSSCCVKRSACVATRRYARWRPGQFIHRVFNR